VFNENSLTDWIGEERLVALRRIRPDVPPGSLFLTNQQISSAVFEDCSLVEIALRNKLSSELAKTVSENSRLEKIRQKTGF
jgi:hypothetical protein